MKPVRIKRPGLLLAVTAGIALAGLVANASPALAQAQGGSQTGETPMWRSALFGSSAPLIDVSEQPGYLQGLSVSGFINQLNGMWIDSGAIRYQRSKNSVASERSWLQ